MATGLAVVVSAVLGVGVSAVASDVGEFFPDIGLGAGVVFAPWAGCFLLVGMVGVGCQ